jgi:hypothetical protein
MNEQEKPGAKQKVAELIETFTDGFISGAMTGDEAEWIIERLCYFTDETLDQVVEMLASADEDIPQVAITLLDELNDPRAAGPLRQMLDQSEYSQEEKLEIIQVLAALGSPVDEATLRRTIPDPDALVERATSQMLEVIQDPAHAEVTLAQMSEGSPEIQEQYMIEVLGPLADRRLLPMLTALLYSEHDAVVVAAIEAIELLKEPGTIPLLEERAEYDPSHQVRHAAETAFLRLQVRLGDQPPQPWTSPSPLPLLHCLLSTIDGSGGQVLFVVREEPEGDMRIVDLMFNDHEGIKDCFSVVVDQDGLDEIVGSFESSDFVDISLERARAEIARAYQVTLEAHRRLPPALMLWKDWLEGKDPRAIEEFSLPSLEPAQQAELLADCVELLALEEFDYWFFNPDEVDAFLPRYRKMRRLRQVSQRGASYESLVDDAIEAVAGERHRRLLPGRLRRQAWLLAQLYEEEEVPLWALAAAAALEEGVLTEHPLLRGMMDRSFLNAIREYL